MANQSIEIYNLKNKENQKPLLTLDELELLTAPSMFNDLKDVITEAMTRGFKRNVLSESDEKNSNAG